MKKLTPFQKKVARWCDRLSDIATKAIVLSIILAMVLSFVFLVLSFNGSAGKRGLEVERPGMLLVACLLILYWCVSPFLSSHFAEWKLKLPERYRKDAQELLKEHLGFSGILNPMIQESIASDDGSRLAEKLEEINNFLALIEKLISKRECLGELEKEIPEIKNQIAALGKELGIK